MEYASKGVGNAGLTTGIIGSALGAMNSGILPGLFGGGNCGCSENTAVNRYELGLEKQISAKDSEIALLKSNIYVDGKLGDLRDYVERRFDRVEHELCDQKVYNATMNGTVSCIQGQIAQLQSLTKLVIPNASVCPGWDTTTTG